MTATEWVEEIRGALNAQADRSTADFRKVRRGFSKRLKDADAELVLEVALGLVALGQPYRWAAYELVHYHRPALETLNAAMSSGRRNGRLA